MLDIRSLRVKIGAHEIVTVDELGIGSGERVGLVGESGSGKTLTAMSIAGLQPRDAVLGGSIRFDGTELVGRADKELRDIRGAKIGVIFQDPLRALNPTMRVGRQIAEAVRLHESLPRAELRTRVMDLMSQVQLRDPKQFVRRYPHELSGGQRQRILIAMAIASQPKLLIADEPTTALDVTVQSGILELILRLSSEHGMGLLFVSHNLGVVRLVTERVAVMYGGQLVESGRTEDVIDRHRHRYTEALISANPGQLSEDDFEAAFGQRLQAIAGSVPAVGHFPSGCRFRDRCSHAIDSCVDDPPVVGTDTGHRYRCWNPLTASGGGRVGRAH